MTRYVNNIGISASHNISLTQDEVDLAEAYSVEKYLERGLMSTVKFKRSLEGIQRGFDENKFIFPLYTQDGILPLVSVPIISALHTNPNQVSVLGSYDVGRVVEAIRHYFVQTKRTDLSDKLVFVSEMPEEFGYSKSGIKNLTLFNSFSKLRDSFNSSEPYIVETGDILAYSFLDLMQDEDILNNKLILDLNAKEMIDARVPRNFYLNGRKRDGLDVSIKEPNTFIFTSDFPLEIIEDYYNYREKGGFYTAVSLCLLKNLVKISMNFEGRRALKSLGGKIKKEDSRIDEWELESLAKGIAPIRFKAEHSDPLRLIDVDGLEDLVMLQHCVEHFDEIFPQDINSDLQAFSQYFQESTASSIQVINDFKSEMNDKVRRVKEHMKDDLGQSLEIPYDKDGTLLLEPREKLDGFLERLREERKNYEQRHNLIQRAA